MSSKPADASPTVAEKIVQALQRHGVKTIFGQSLPSKLVLAAEAAGIRQLAYRQENAGGVMADGFSRISGQIGVVTAQNGPAATLLVAPLAECTKASIPVVALIQEVERNQVHKNAFQEFDHFGLFQSCAKWIRRLDASDRIDDYVDAAFIAAGSGRPGPAVLLLPADLLKEPAAKQSIVRSGSYGRWPIDRTRPGKAVIEEAADAIVKAKMPVVIAGGGVLSSRASAELSRLQEEADLPVFTTFMGKGSVGEEHPLSCGPMGSLTGPRSLGSRMRPILNEADLVILVGNRTNQNGTDSWRIIPAGAKIVHVDVDPNEVGRNYEAIRLIGDAAETLTALADALKQRDLSHRRKARPALEARVAKGWEAFNNDRKIYAGSNSMPIRPERVMAELQTLLTKETIMVADASYSSMWIVGQLRSMAPGMRFLTPRGLAGLGWGLPMAIGAKIARPDARVIVVVGDGGFAHVWSELETLVRSKLAITVIVMNNGVLGFQKDAETAKFGAFTSAVFFSPVDHAAIARGVGCDADSISNPGDILPALRKALGSNKPHLLDMIVDPKAHPPLSVFDGTIDQAI